MYIPLIMARRRAGMFSILLVTKIRMATAQACKLGNTRELNCGTEVIGVYRAVDMMPSLTPYWVGGEEVPLPWV